MRESVPVNGELKLVAESAHTLLESKHVRTCVLAEHSFLPLMKELRGDDPSVLDAAL